MRVLVVASATDTGGQGVRIKRALERHARGVQCDAMAHHRSYIRYPNGHQWDEALLADLYRRADVVQHQNDLSIYRRFDGGQFKPAVLHHQGTRLRNHGARIKAEAAAIGAVEIVSTVDLLLSQPKAEWLPSPYDLDWLARWRRPNRRPTIRIAHAPTARAIKGTESILRVINKLSAQFDIEFDLIEGASWKQCLDRKGRCDIFIDQLILGYGNNAIEAWGMGIPVVCGVADRRVKRAMLREWGELPFVEAHTERALAEQLTALIQNRALRTEWGERGLAHAQRWHDEAVVAQRLVNIYKRAGPTNGPDAMANITLEA